MPSLSRTQENVIQAALGLQVGQRLFGLMNAAEAPTAPTGLALIDHTQPTYVAANDYAETIDGTRVTYLTVNAVKLFWEDTLTLAPKHIMLYVKRESLIQKIWHSSTVRSSKWQFVL